MQMAASFVKVATFALLVFFAVGHDDEVGCVTDYNNTKDYFPHKATIEYAEYFNITYNNSYKIIDVNAGSYYGTQKIIAYQCGTPIPEWENDTDIFVEIPVKYVAVSSTPMIPYIEILGERKSIKAVATNTSLVASACLNEMLDDGYTLDATSGAWGINDTILEKAGVNVTFDPSMGSYNAVAFVEYLESTSQGVSEWLDFVAAFYNLEEEAEEIIDEVIDRIECLTDNAALYSETFPGVTPKVMYSVWYPGYGYFSTGSCPNYYCDLIEAAGGTPLTNGTYVQYDEWLALAKRADYIWHVGDFGYLYDEYSSDSDFTSLSAVVNQRVYDTSGNGKKDWFESRFAEPDVVLEDLINFLQNCTNPDHDRVWLRNYFTEDKGAASTTCSDWGAALEIQADDCSDLSADDLEDQCFDDSGSTDDEAGAPRGAAGGHAAGALLAAASVGAGLLLLLLSPLL
mmetsp:Transcript_18370/g.27712  ORF Transcript_18370/g.27712 Transcript_18370/m.27712 type:complete len:457 (+) Transcript_18370:85-1455(+)